MSTSNSAIIQVTVFGHLISLIGNYKSDEGILFIMDVEEEDKDLLQLNYDELSEEEQKIFQDNFEVDDELKGQLDEQYGKSPDWKKKLLKLFDIIKIKNVALFRDTVNKKTLFYLNIFVHLEDVIKSKDNNFALQFISFDLILSSEEKIKQEDRDRKEKILETKQALKGRNKVTEKVSTANQAFAKMEKTFGKVQKNILELQKQLGTKNLALEKATAALEKGQKALNKVNDQVNEYHKKTANLKERLKKADEIKKTYEKKKEKIENTKLVNKDSEEWKEIKESLAELWQ